MQTAISTDNFVMTVLETLMISMDAWAEAAAALVIVFLAGLVAGVIIAASAENREDDDRE